MPQVRGRSLVANLGCLADAPHYLKPSFTKQLHSETGFAGSFWQKRYYDRNVRDKQEFVEKLRYFHRNPGSPASPLLACWGGSRMKRGLVKKCSGLEVEQLSPLCAAGGRGSRNPVRVHSTQS